MAENEMLTDVPLTQIRDFLHHPYLVKDDESMDELVESIKERGLIQPVIIRPVEDGMYEMVSGHRRKRAFEIAGYEKIPARVKEMSRDEAILSMVDSNLQRETVLPSEKARAYKMRLDALRRQVGRPTKNNSDPTGPNLTGTRSNTELAAEVKESETQIKRYIRLNYLVPEMLDLVDEGKVAMRPAVEISYLPEEIQYDLLEAMEYNEATPSHDQTMSMTYDVAKNLTANGFTRTSYKFKNWNTKSDGSGTSYKDKQSVKNLTTTDGATVNLYAQWEYDPVLLVEQCSVYEGTKSDKTTLFGYTKGNVFDDYVYKSNYPVMGDTIWFNIHFPAEIESYMLVVLDSILNRITKNRAEGRETYIFIDEIYLLFRHQYTADFLFTLWKRVRKYGAFCTGITQNVDDMMQSHTARTMLANSEFIIMLNQGSTDRDDLANLLQISDDQMKHITNVDAGHGLVKVGSDLVPFERKFPKNTQLYKLMTTKMGE